MGLLPHSSDTPSRIAIKLRELALLGETFVVSSQSTFGGVLATSVKRVAEIFTFLFLTIVNLC